MYVVCRTCCDRVQPLWEVWRSVCLAVCLSVCLSGGLSVCLSGGLSVCLAVCLSVQYCYRINLHLHLQHLNTKGYNLTTLNDQLLLFHTALMVR